MGVLGPLGPPENIFFANFQRLVHLCGLSAFQRALTYKFTLTLSRLMMFLVKLGFLVENIGVLHCKIGPKMLKLHM